MTFFEGPHGQVYPYCTHEYNAARTNERAVEIPIFVDWMDRHPGKGLEVGNVLGHYATEHGWLVVDRYERAHGVVNTDILDFKPSYKFDWIVSISTVEHIGWDDDPRDEWKAATAIECMRRMLKPEGRMLLSFPSGHHARLDKMAAAGGLGEDWSCFMVRTDKPTERCPGTWEPLGVPLAPALVDPSLVLDGQPVGHLFPYLHHAWSAGAVWIGEFGPLDA